MLAALVAGEEDAQMMAGLALGKLRNKKAALEEALHGRLEAHQRFLLAAQLRHIDNLGVLIEEVGGEIEERLRPFEEEWARLTTIPGVGRRTAETLLSELGYGYRTLPLRSSPCPDGLVSALATTQNAPASRGQAGRKRKGSPWLRSALVEAARAAARSRTYLGAQYHRIAARRGANRAAVAVAHSILTIVYHILARGQIYVDLGDNYFDQLHRDRVCSRRTHRLEALGYSVSLRPAV